MDRIDTMRIFTRIVERSSFTAAADDLQIPRATVTDAVKRLESRLGVRLLERTTRHVSPTLDGAAYYSRCVQLLADIEDAENVFRDPAPSGLLRVDLQGMLASHFLLPHLAAFMARYPALELHIGENDRLVDLVREGVDCVLRAGTLQDSSLIGRRVARLEQVTVASPTYLARFGIPKTVDELADPANGHRAVNFISSATGRPFPYEFTIKGKVRNLMLPGPVSVNGAEVYVRSAVAGLGLVQLPRYRIENLLKQKELELVLPDNPPPPMPVSVVYPQSRQLSPRVRVFVEWVADSFAKAGLQP
jgi:DNA-binding transcriptional LysR family regulator